MALKGRGRVHLTEAGDLHSGLALLDARPFDLVMLDTRLRDVSALWRPSAPSESTRPTPRSCRTPTFLTVETRHAARQRGAWDVVVRGGLNAMWSAMSNLLAVSASELRAKPGLQPT